MTEGNGLHLLEADQQRWWLWLWQEAEVPLQELDWMVCNSGADIWHLLQSKDGKARTWSSDEQWDIHITFRHVTPPFPLPAPLTFSWFLATSLLATTRGMGCTTRGRLAGVHPLF